METEQRARELNTQQRQHDQNRQELMLNRSKIENNN